MNQTTAPARFITFYSYKGGTGRSMALANVAWLLARAGRKVLTLDWDVEAPGLHRYFHPFLSDPELSASDGVIDFVTRFVEAASALDGSQKLPADWYKPYSNIAPLATPLDYAFPGEGVLDFIPAGRQWSGYAARVNSFNWKQFYEKVGGWSVIDEMRAQLAPDYEFIFLDSRTGVSDTSGICTVQIPEVVVICFTLNYQSVDGAAQAAASVLQKRIELKRPIRLLPVPMRVINEEKFKLEEVTAYAQARFFPLIQESDIPEGLAREKYWQEVMVPHVGFYGFEEQLAWFLEPATQVAGVLASMKRLTRYLTGIDLSELAGPESEERKEFLGRFGAVWTNPVGVVVAPTTTDASVEAPGIYVSLDDRDTQTVAPLTSGLASAGEIFQTTQLPRDPTFDDWIRASLDRSKAMVVAIGVNGVSPLQQREMLLAFKHRSQQLKAGHGFPIVPVVLQPILPTYRPASADPLIDLSTRDNAELKPAAISGALEPFLKHLDGRAFGTGSPYPGLRAFRIEEAELFFGRESALSRLAEEVQQRTDVTISGPLGCGRTSLAAAGLIPQLLESSSVRWKVATFSADTDVLSSLAESLMLARHGGSREQFKTEGEALVSALSHGDANALRSAIRLTLASWPAADRLLLVADDVAPDDQAVRLLRTWIVDLPVTLLSIVNAGTTIPPLTRDELRTAIEAPGRLAGLRLDSTFVDTLLTDLEREVNPLPLLQLVMRRVNQLAQGATLSSDLYDRIGRVANVVKVWADEAITPMGDDRALCVITRLIAVSSTSAPRVRTITSDLLDPVWQPDVAVLVESEIIVVQHMRNGAVQYRLATPMLLDRWPSLVQEVTTDRAFLVLRQRVESAARSGAAVSELLNGDNTALLSVRREWLTGAENEFLRRSLEERERSDVQSLAASHTRRRTVGTVGIIAAVIVGVVFTISWFTYHNRSTVQSLATIRKVSGDGQVVATAAAIAPFEVSVLRDGQPARKTKIAWGCSDRQFVTETDEKGVSAVKYPCSDVAAGNHQVPAATVDNDTPLGYQPTSGVKLLAPAVTFGFAISGDLPPQPTDPSLAQRLEQWGGGPRVDQLTSTEIAVRVAADKKLTSVPVEASCKRTTVQYYAPSKSLSIPDTLLSVWQTFEFGLEEKRYGIAQPVNAVWYGRDVAPLCWRAVATTLIRAGIAVRYVGPASKDQDLKRLTIEVSYSGPSRNNKAKTLDEIWQGQ